MKDVTLKQWKVSTSVVIAASVAYNTVIIVNIPRYNDSSERYFKKSV